MTKKRIDLIDKKNKNGKSIGISGRDLGKLQRARLKLDEEDTKDNVCEVFVENNIIVISTSYFLGMFGDSVRTLGSREKFLDKYNFICNPKALKYIEDGIIQAFKRGALEEK